MQPTIDPIEAQARMLATALDWLMAPGPTPPIEGEADESEEEEGRFHRVEFGPPPDPTKCAETLTFLHDQDHVGTPVEHGTRTALDTAHRPRKTLGDFDVSICQPRQRGMCMHVLSLPSNYVPVPRDPASAGAAAGEEV